MKYAGNVAVVTGAGGALGRALCLELSTRLGMKIAAIEIDAEKLAETEKAVASFGGRVYGYCLDLRDTNSLRDAAKDMEHRLGPIKIWVNNAGVSCLGAFHEIDAHTYDAAIAINFHTTVNGTRIAMKLMLESGAGVVVNIASVSGHIAAPYMSAYSASKHAIVGFTRALCEEQRLLQNPIRFVLVSPGFFDSSMLKSHAKLQLGDWFKSMVGNAADVATATVDAIVKQKFEVVPTMNGKVAIALNHFIPSTLRRASPRLLAKD